MASSAPVMTPPSQAQAADALMAASIDAYLRKKGSPIAGSGADIVAVGREFDLDPRLLVAIAGAETGFGTDITAGANNVCNILYNGHDSPYPSYARAFHGAGKSIRNRANGYRLTNTTIFYAKFDDPKDKKGLGDLNTFMHEQGASLTSLTFPK